MGTPQRRRFSRKRFHQRTETRVFVERLEDRIHLSTARQMEYLDRGVVAFRTGSGSTGSIYIGWRMLGTDPGDVGFNLYCSTNGGAATKINSGSPITTSTNFVQSSQNYSQSHTYFVRPVINGTEQPNSETYTLPANAAFGQHIDIPLSAPPNPTLPDGSTYSYNANDASTGDLDGDGKYEIILKWDPSDSHDSSQDGFTGNTYYDAYKLDGTRLWRINLGQNIRAGAHYTQFMVYDFDGDGKAEIVMKTAPGTIDGQGNPVLLSGDHVTDDYRNSTTGRINTGPEYLTVFNGETGAAMATVPFKPDRINTSSWGDDYGNRQDRILMAVAYLDGKRPSLVVGRGIFPGQNSSHAVRNEVTAWDWRGGNFTMRWWFRADKNTSAYGLPNVNTNYIGQGTYNMHPADVDGDGRDEIVYGSMTINDNGAGLYSTGLGHGDAMMVGDMIPSHPGLEIYMPMEDPGSNGHITTNIHDGATGSVLFATYTTPAGSTDPDVGRGNAMDIDPNHPGFETWDSYNGSIYSNDGSIIQAKPSNMFTNFGIWWDADPMRELLDGATISDWKITGGVGARNNLVSSGNSGINSSAGLSGNNGTKNTPCLVADLLGDWREEVVWRKSDNSALQIWSTTIVASNRMYTLMDDTQYRESVAWQNVGYNQPTATSFFLGAADSTGAFPTIPAANIYLVGGPPAPGSLLASAINANRIDLSWSAVAGASGYNLKRATTSGGPYTTIATNIAQTTFIDTTVSASTRYYYVVSSVAAGGGGQGADSTQTSVVTPPVVVQASFQYDAPVNSLTVQFSGNVSQSLSIDDVIINSDRGPQIVPTDYTYDAGSNTATFVLSTPLPDAIYTASFVPGGVTDVQGNALSGDFSFNFFSLAGDANHDGAVDVADLNIAASNFQQTGKTFSQGDFNYDGRVDIADLQILSANWNKRINDAALASPMPALAPLSPPPVEVAALTTARKRTPVRVITLI